MQRLLKREAVIDVRATCDRLLNYLKEMDIFSVLSGAARVLSRAERRGRVVIEFASAKRREGYRVEAEQAVISAGIAYILHGDLEGAVRLAALPRGSGCRLYVEAEASGPLLDEYGAEALSRIVNRVIVNIVARFPAVLQPRLPGGRLGDVFIELLGLVNLAVGGHAPLGKGGRLKSLAINIETGELIEHEGIEKDIARDIAEKLSSALKPLTSVLESLGAGQADRIIVSAASTVLVASHAAGISVITILEKEEESRP